MSIFFERLGVGKNPTIDEVKKAWRELAKTLHPDHGGDAAEFHRMNHIYQQALRVASLPKVCVICKGTKKINKTVGFHTLKIPCPLCTKIKTK
jgi:hypothetical protein